MRVTQYLIEVQYLRLYAVFSTSVTAPSAVFFLCKTVLHANIAAFTCSLNVFISFIELFKTFAAFFLIFQKNLTSEHFPTQHIREEKCFQD